jgi:hypothetical protein
MFLSARIERHMERGEELMELCRLAFKENQQAFKESREAFEENRLFVRDMTRRSEKVVQELVRSHERFHRELSAEMRSKTDAILAELREGREESRAQRQALLALIDRLPPPAEAA